MIKEKGVCTFAFVDMYHFLGNANLDFEGLIQISDMQ